MTAPDDVCARFEAWMCSIGLGSLLDKTPARHDGSFEYISAGTQHRWLGYHATLADLARRCEVLQYLAAAMYQAAGAYDMPVRFLDVLSAAGNGKPITEEQVDALLPCETPDLMERCEAAERDARRYRHIAAEHGVAWEEELDAAIDATQEGEG